VKIAIVGTGNVGGTLGRGWAAKGHDILFAVRNPADAKHAAFADSVPGRVRMTTVPDAASQTDVIVLSSPWPTVPEVIRSAGDLVVTQSQFALPTRETLLHRVTAVPRTRQIREHTIRTRVAHIVLRLRLLSRRPLQ